MIHPSDVPPEGSFSVSFSALALGYAPLAMYITTASVRCRPGGKQRVVTTFDLEADKFAGFRTGQDQALLWSL